MKNQKSFITHKTRCSSYNLHTNTQQTVSHSHIYIVSSKDKISRHSIKA